MHPIDNLGRPLACLVIIGAALWVLGSLAVAEFRHRREIRSWRRHGEAMTALRSRSPRVLP